jgi:transposase
MKCLAQAGHSYPVSVIHETGLDGFWSHRRLQKEGIESHILDPASIATSRRQRRAKTGGIDGESLVRALLAWKWGEPRVCAMVAAPTPEAEDRRQISRERRSLTAERVADVNRIKGLLFAQGICDTARRLAAGRTTERRIHICRSDDERGRRFASGAYEVCRNSPASVPQFTTCSIWKEASTRDPISSSDATLL